MSKVGNETKADTSGAGLDSTRAMDRTGSVVGESGLMKAVKHLHGEHPIAYDALGPHHGGSDHVRHMPLAGMTAKKTY